MTTITCIGCIVVIAIMTDSTVVAMAKTIEHIIVVVHRKGGRAPSRCCGMTGSTIGRYAQSPVVRIVGSYILGIMTIVVRIGVLL